MSEIVTKGVGLMQRKVEIINAADDPEAFQRAFADIKGPEQVWAEAEEWCLGVLRRAGVEGIAEKAPDFDLRFPEDSAQWLARAWLRAWRGAKAARESGDFVVAMMSAEKMGQLKERVFWRLGLDPDTRERREALALQARKSRMALKGDADGGKASANAARHAEAEEWRAVARKLAETSPFGGARLEGRVLAELERRGFPARSGPAIRRAIKGIRRPD